MARIETHQRHIQPEQSMEFVWVGEPLWAAGRIDVGDQADLNAIDVCERQDPQATHLDATGDGGGRAGDQPITVALDDDLIVGNQVCPQGPAVVVEGRHDQAERQVRFAGA